MSMMADSPACGHWPRPPACMMRSSGWRTLSMGCVRSLGVLSFCAGMISSFEAKQTPLLSKLSLTPRFRIKSEIRKKAEIRNPKAEVQSSKFAAESNNHAFSDFGFRPSFGPRPSDFGLYMPLNVHSFYSFLDSTRSEEHTSEL